MGFAPIYDILRQIGFKQDRFDPNIWYKRKWWWIVRREMLILGETAWTYHDGGSNNCDGFGMNTLVSFLLRHMRDTGQL